MRFSAIIAAVCLAVVSIADAQVPAYKPPIYKHVPKSGNFAVVASDNGTIFEVTTGASAITATLPPAATLGNGFGCIIRKADTGTGTVIANSTMIGVQGQTIQITCDGASVYSIVGFGAFDATGNLNLAASSDITFTPGTSGFVRFRKPTIVNPTNPAGTAQFNGDDLDAAHFIYVPNFDTALPVPTTATTGQFFSGFDVFGQFSFGPAQEGQISIGEEVIGDEATHVINNVLITAIKIDTPLTQDLQITLPDITLYASSRPIRIYDATGNPNGKTVTIVPRAGQTIGTAASLAINEGAGKSFSRTILADPNSLNWTTMNAAGTSTSLTPAPFSALTVVSGMATLTANPGLYSTENNTLTLTGDTTLNIVGAANGRTGRLRVTQSGAGGWKLTVTNGYTPSGGASILFGSAGSGAIDEFGWDYDGTTYNVHPLGYNFTKAAAATYNTMVEDTAGGVTTTGNYTQGTNNQKFLACLLVADGGVTDGSTYTEGKQILRLWRNVSPTHNLFTAYFADSGALSPTTTQVGNASSTPVAAAGLGSGSANEGDATFDANAQLIGARAVASVGTTINTPTITKTGGFIAGDVGCLVQATNLAAGTTITAIGTGGNSATVSTNATSTTTLTVTIRHPYWLALYGDNAAADPTNNVSWAFGGITSTGVQRIWHKTATGSWAAFTSSTSQMSKYQTFKP
jgi:hypothetical protein